MAMDAERNIEVQFRVETLGDEAFAAHVIVIKIKEPLATIRADVKDFEAVKRFMKTTAESRANIADNLRFLSRWEFRKLVRWNLYNSYAGLL